MAELSTFFLIQLYRLAALILIQLYGPYALILIHLYSLAALILIQLHSLAALILIQLQGPNLLFSMSSTRAWSTKPCWVLSNQSRPISCAGLS